MLRRFIKMHGCGNDFVIFDERVRPLDLDTSSFAMLADRHRGIGCDQLICLKSDAQADGLMQIYNADGSVAGACGNATRCVADIIMREKGTSAASIRTAAGLLHARRLANGQIEVDMGPARLDWDAIPLARPMDTLHLALPGDPAAASMGNPHATFFVDDLEACDITGLGPRYEHDPLFPERANIGFAQILDPSTIRLRVWERGSGLTLACGSGACATAVNAARRGLTGRAVRVIVDGGTLDIAWQDNGHVNMAGDATMVFTGELTSP
ncbi:MAG TPA: diaminopimelate epimerase [Rhodopila sp.]|uniref:diaminopimelate epimerase n=1 Tax=Rhodopila sp. TaxID=2480087 RepID=UPI002CBB2084|nr:diaminopimelate epimerase [Rhodopila sp.]HVY13710.1 diaminopimelate epimerase [Rhodopila sp.]